MQLRLSVRHTPTRPSSVSAFPAGRGAAGQAGDCRAASERGGATTIRFVRGGGCRSGGRALLWLSRDLRWDHRRAGPVPSFKGPSRHEGCAAMGATRPLRLFSSYKGRFDLCDPCCDQYFFDLVIVVRSLSCRERQRANARPRCCPATGRRQVAFTFEYERKNTKR